MLVVRLSVLLSDLWSDKFSAQTKTLHYNSDTNALYPNIYKLNYFIGADRDGIFQNNAVRINKKNITLNSYHFLVASTVLFP